MKKKTEILLLTADVRPLAVPDHYEAAYRSVSAERQAKADQLKFDKDKRLCIGAGVLVNIALRHRGYEPGKMNFNIGEHGKPFVTFADDPSLRPPVYFNLSHSGDVAVCAVFDHPVGCDIEKIGEGDLRLAKRFFAPSEYKDIASQKVEQSKRFFRYWTLKESVIKALGTGLSLPLNAFEILLDDDGIRARGTGVSSANFEKLTFAETDLIEGYCFAVCATDKFTALKTELISFEKIFPL